MLGKRVAREVAENVDLRDPRDKAKARLPAAIPGVEKSGIMAGGFRKDKEQYVFKN